MRFMIVATTMHQPAVTTAILSGGQWLTSLLPARSASTEEATDVMLRIGVADFGLHLAAPLADLSTARNYSEVTVQARIDPGVFVSLTLKNEPESRTIFGQTVALGDETVFLDDAAILNREEVLRELSLDDGHIVPVTFRP